jgi:hypothetical protein
MNDNNKKLHHIFHSLKERVQISVINLKRNNPKEDVWTKYGDPILYDQVW